MDPFFKLKGQTGEFVDSRSFFAALNDPTRTTIQDSQYSPDELVSTAFPRLWRIRDKTFRNFSFAKTEIKELEFQNCTFEGCLFMGTIFSNCRFTDCRFISCNVHRFELRNVYVNPKAFSECIPNKNYANIGVHLFQELLRNSRMQAQPDYADVAQFMFRRWQRYLNWDELKEFPLHRRPAKTLPVVGAWMFELFLGSGVRLRNLACTTIGLVVALSLMHWELRESLGLTSNGAKMQTIIDAFYFTSVTLTTLGYGDISPSTEIGRIVIGFEALLGFVLLATLASTIFRKFSS